MHFKSSQQHCKCSSNPRFFNENSIQVRSNGRIFVHGQPNNERLFVPDGMTIDRYGNLWVADIALARLEDEPGLPGSTVHVYNPSGDKLETFAPPEGAINLTFVPAGADTLYFTSQTSLWRVPFFFENSSGGDFDNNGELDANDVELLTNAELTGDLDFDLNGDGVINFGDREVWVSDLKRSWFGDANLGW